MKTLIFWGIVLVTLGALRLLYVIVRRIMEKRKEDFEKRDY